MTALFLAGAEPLRFFFGSRGAHSSTSVGHITSIPQDWLARLVGCVWHMVRLQKFEVPGRAHHGLALRLRVHPPTTQSCAATTGCVVASISSTICLIFDSSRIQRGWSVGGRLRLTALGLSRHLSSPFPFLPNRQLFRMFISSLPIYAIKGLRLAMARASSSQAGGCLLSRVAESSDLISMRCFVSTSCRNYNLTHTAHSSQYAPKLGLTF